MDALDVLKVCFRRWYVMLPILMMALGTGYSLAKNQQDSYYASAAFAFVFQSSDPAQQETRVLNPLADNELLGTALALALANPDEQERLGDPAASGVAPGETSEENRRFAFTGSGYTYTVASWAPTADAAETTVGNVMEAIPGVVEEIQRSAGAPDGTLSTIFVMSPTRVEVVPAGSGLKMLIGVGAVGAIAGAALSIVADALLSRRARVRRARAAAAATASDAAATAVSGDDGNDGDDGPAEAGGGEDDGDDDAPRADGDNLRAEERSGHGSRKKHRRVAGRRKADARTTKAAVQQGAVQPPAARLTSVESAPVQPPSFQPATVQLVAVPPVGPGEPGRAPDSPPSFESLFR